jgi:hypothetical protein
MVDGQGALRVGPWDFVTCLSSAALHGDTAALVAVANEVRIPIRDSDDSVYLLSAVDSPRRSAVSWTAIHDVLHGIAPRCSGTRHPLQGSKVPAVHPPGEPRAPDNAARAARDRGYTRSRAAGRRRAVSPETSASRSPANTRPLTIPEVRSTLFQTHFKDGCPLTASTLRLYVKGELRSPRPRAAFTVHELVT